jgi:hypothetical protein
MPIFRCEFDVKGDLVLPAHVSELKLNSKDGFLTIFRNGPSNSDGHTTHLVAVVFGPAESIDSAQKELREVISEQLDLLTFTTHSRFQIIAPRRLIEWEPNQERRRIHTFYKQDARFPPEPGFALDYIETVEQLEHAAPPAFTRTALKYFRLGLIDNLPEDQFMRLWLALEIIAENVKNIEPMVFICPTCKASLKCAECGTVPTRVPMAKQAIEDLIARIAGTQAQDISKRQFITRNGLMHGRSSNSIEAECKVPLHVIVNELGALTWQAIMSTIPPGDGLTHVFGHRDGEFANKSLLMTVRGTFGYTGADDYPPEDKIPQLDIKMVKTFENNTGVTD